MEFRDFSSFASCRPITEANLLFLHSHFNDNGNLPNITYYKPKIRQRLVISHWCISNYVDVTRFSLVIRLAKSLILYVPRTPDLTIPSKFLNGVWYFGLRSPRSWDHIFMETPGSLGSTSFASCVVRLLVIVSYYRKEPCYTDSYTVQF